MNFDISKETIQNNQQIQPTRMNIIELPREQFVSTISETPKELQELASLLGRFKKTSLVLDLGYLIKGTRIYA